MSDLQVNPIDQVRLTGDDVYLFNEGNHFNLGDKLGAHLTTENGQPGVYFAVWAPNANYVSVIGDFNGWDKANHPLEASGNSGIWHGFLPGIEAGCVYKFHVGSHHDGYQVDKADPFGIRHEVAPRTGSVVWHLDYEWRDEDWMEHRKNCSRLDSPISIYEVHLGSWLRSPDDPDHVLSYRDIAPQLAEHVKKLGFTHVEFLPLTEHPFYGSWGYQATGYFAPTSRYGSPQDFMHLVDTLHQEDVGVILDWVPSHFPNDEHGLAYFDGTHLFEHADPRQGFHPDWNSCIFNYGRNEIRSFLISSALFWLNHYHIDGIRVDAVASMLYLDYSRKEGEWIPNEFGGRENLEAISFLRQFNEEVYRVHPDVQTFAEESTSWPMVSKPTNLGGLGFGLKWDMGWMHDTLKFFEHETIHRKYHHGMLTFRMIYAFHENFVLPLSHDEVVHGKGSLLRNMPGDDWQKFANLRLLYGYMFGQPGKKLLFMGAEFGQWEEWKHDSSLDWHLLKFPQHTGLQNWVGTLNSVYRREPALHQLDCSHEGFEWIDANDADTSVLSYLRKGTRPQDRVVVVLNLTPVVRHNYRIGVSDDGYWREILNSDASGFGGSGQGNLGGVQAAEIPWHGRPYSLNLTLPPLGILFLKLES